MSSVASSDGVPYVAGRADARQRRRLTTAIKESMRDLGNQLTLLNHHVGSRLEIKDIDFDCLEVINRYGPTTPSTIARRAGLHPATMTGVLDRLERGGWITGTGIRRRSIVEPSPYGRPATEWARCSTSTRG